MFNSSLMQQRKGFTLIELLIVITIIGILAVALVPRITQGPARARDTKRRADIQNIATAMELYYSDKGAYPGTAGTLDCLTATSTVGALLVGYLQGGNIPMDPGGGQAIGGNCTNDGYYYRGLTADATSTAISSYVLAADLEVDTAAAGDGIYCPADTADDNWAYLAGVSGVSETLSGATCPGAGNAAFIVAR